MTPQQTKSKQQYERWKQVNIKPETKYKLEAICEALSNDWATVKQATMLEILITEKYNSLAKSGAIQK